MPSDKDRNSKVTAARAFASGGHERIAPGGAPRQQTAEAHLKAVAQLVASVTEDEDAIAAAWLHDIVGDTSVTVGQVERRFGKRVSMLVAELTPQANPGRAGRAAALAAEKKRLAGISAEAKTIKLADLIDTICDLRKRDGLAACAFAAEARDLAQVLDGGDARLRQRLAREVERCGEAPSAAGPANAATPARLVAVPTAALRAFERAFSAEDIAEPLLSFDEEHDGHGVLDAVCQAGAELAGVRKGGVISGYVEAPDLGDGPCAAARRQIVPGQVVAGSASLADVIDVLTVHDWCFVTSFGAVAGVISRRDIQKPATRMWLFGIITVAEMEATTQVTRRWPGDAWTALVSPARLAGAKQLFEERQRRKETCRLIDCLQLSDKLEIVVSDAAQLAAFGLPTATAARRIAKQIERLRNNLAHAQILGDADWPQIVRFARRVANFPAV